MTIPYKYGDVLFDLDLRSAGSVLMVSNQHGALTMFLYFLHHSHTVVSSQDIAADDPNRMYLKPASLRLIQTGMENPIYTFATPTIISGDRENVDVIAHELAHSWSGNLVSNASWEHFWLNEGWTTYLERRLIAGVRGEPYRDFSAIIGWKALEDSVELYG